MVKIFMWKNITLFASWLLIILLAGLACLAPIFWYLVGLFWAVVLILKLCLKLVTARGSIVHSWVSLKRMWILPIIFLAMLPWYYHVRHSARAAGDQLVQQVEQYHQTHGAYPSDQQVLGDASRKAGDDRRFDPFYGYDAEAGKPHVLYRDPLMIYGFYAYDFALHTWRYYND